METVKQTEDLLNELKGFNYDRRLVESTLGYSKGYIDQTLSKSKKDKKEPSFNPILRVLLEKARLERKITTLESGNPAKAVSEEMKKHLDALMQQADAMKKIIDASISSDDPQRKIQKAHKETQGPRKRKFPEDRVRASGDKSVVQDHPHGPDSKNAKDK